MAIVSCPECGGKVSDSADWCPLCGNDMQPYRLSVSKLFSSMYTFATFTVLLPLAIILLAMAFMLFTSL